MLLKEKLNQTEAALKEEQSASRHYLRLLKFAEEARCPYKRKLQEAEIGSSTMDDKDCPRHGIMAQKDAQIDALASIMANRYLCPPTAETCCCSPDLKAIKDKDGNCQSKECWLRWATAEALEMACQ